MIAAGTQGEADWLQIIEPPVAATEMKAKVMSLVIGVCITLGFFAGGLVYVLFRKQIWGPLTLGSIVGAGCLVWFLTPVCIQVLPEDLARFSPPISTRTETGMIGQRYFQRRNGIWFHCKVRIARQMFF